VHPELWQKGLAIRLIERVADSRRRPIAKLEDHQIRCEVACLFRALGFGDAERQAICDWAVANRPRLFPRRVRRNAFLALGGVL
jgi:hypothetical protein